jgi:hypothetical protein
LGPQRASGEALKYCRIHGRIIHHRLWEKEKNGNNLRIIVEHLKAALGGNTTTKPRLWLG